ncbi:sulfur carrier protein ThiS [Desulfuromonas sp. KJ2020]|uniref:sulfur carrier protein ThiS n=1 Tax=Desulfuromonas sp. KJ2020 TaxID=2919173 RepID=UPI0020A7B921|nr:sulfur carrier protein ThiS [Desulfuromonas sp. KJ2020]MCP3176913.1 sulfur carrier protein ThiS [Desulfuromonas sp. KJ2020]
MTILLNGREKTLEAALTVAELIEQLQLADDRVAVELNRAIVPRQAFATTHLQDGDRIEIVHFVGGG